MEKQFEQNSFSKRVKSMLKVDLRRMFTMKTFYIFAFISLLAPILILVMTTLMDGTVSVDPQTGVETIVKGFDNVWQILGSISGASTEIMSLTSMCNINLIYFALAVLVGLFVSDDFKSGYSKNLFTVRAKKSDYVISKTIVCFVAGAILIVLFFLGSMFGGVFSGLSFGLVGINAFNLVMCLLSKLLLVAVFVPIFLATSVGAKQRTWISIVGSLAAGMLLFSMIPMITPLNSTMLNVILCLAGGLGFSFGLGAISNLILRKTDLI